MSGLENKPRRGRPPKANPLDPPPSGDATRLYLPTAARAWLRKHGGAKRLRALLTTAKTIPAVDLPDEQRGKSYGVRLSPTLRGKIGRMAERWGMSESHAVSRIVIDAMAREAQSSA